MSARIMRRVLVDAARAKGADKRGGQAVRVSLSETATLPADLGEDVIALNDALDELEGKDVRKARIVELRFFAGLSIEETAAVLDVSPQTVGREWTFIKAWLRRELKPRKSTTFSSPTKVGAAPRHNPARRAATASATRRRT